MSCLGCFTYAWSFLRGYLWVVSPQGLSMGGQASRCSFKSTPWGKASKQLRAPQYEPIKMCTFKFPPISDGGQQPLHYFTTPDPASLLPWSSGCES